MATTLDYKCPHCGGKLEFQPGTEQLQCPYCDSVVDVAALQNLDEVLKNTPADEMHYHEDAGAAWSEGEQAAMQVYVCKSCGGEIISDENTAATSCPFCGNPVVLSGRLSGVLKPDYVIPFQLDKKAAKDALKKHLEGKRLLPKVFKSEHHIDEIKGIYVPFWLFDASADADLNFKGTRTRMWSDSKFNYTETFRIRDIITKNSRPFLLFRIRFCTAQHPAKSVAIENIIAENHRAGILTDKLFTQKESLSQTIRRRLHFITEIDPKLGPITEQIFKTRRILRC